MDFGQDNSNFAYAYGRPLPPGKYTALVLEAKEAVAKESKNPYLLLVLGIDGGPEGGVKVDHRVVPSHTPTVDEFVRALLPDRIQEWQDSNRTSVKGVEPADLVGLECDVETYLEEYEGRDYVRAKLLPAKASA